MVQVIFNNIQWCNILNFLQNYLVFLYWSAFNLNFNEEKRYYSFYFLLIDNLLNIKKEVNIKKLIEEKKIKVLKINSQILATCCFTNHINYIILLNTIIYNI